MKELLSFDTMLTPKIITVIYFLSLLGMLLAGIFSIVSGSIIPGIVTIVVGSLLVRVYCELLIVVFKMNEALQEIRKK